jgi:hypothetical protein
MAGLLRSILNELILRNQGLNERFCVVFGRNLRKKYGSVGQRERDLWVNWIGNPTQPARGFRCLPKKLDAIAQI